MKDKASKDHWRGAGAKRREMSERKGHVLENSLLG